MGPPTTPSRRRLLGCVAGSLLAPALAGCLSDDTNSPDDDESGGDDQPEDDDESGAENGSDDALNLSEANVVGVEFENEGGDYTFDVTLHHDDDGEDGYANWWQVERLDGTQLGRRELLHAHSQQPFTRTQTITVPETVTCVVVRGHDQSHGYGGQAMLVNLDSTETAAIEQGSEQQSFEDGDCP